MIGYIIRQTSCELSKDILEEKNSLKEIDSNSTAAQIVVQSLKLDYSGPGENVYQIQENKPIYKNTNFILFVNFIGLIAVATLIWYFGVASLGGTLLSMSLNKLDSDSSSALGSSYSNAPANSSSSSNANNASSIVAPANSQASSS